MPEVFNGASGTHLIHWIPAQQNAGMTAQWLCLYTDSNYVELLFICQNKTKVKVIPCENQCKIASSLMLLAMTLRKPFLSLRAKQSQGFTNSP